MKKKKMITSSAYAAVYATSDTSFTTPIPSISLLNLARNVSKIKIKIKGEIGFPCLTPTFKWEAWSFNVINTDFCFFVFVVIAIKKFVALGP